MKTEFRIHPRHGELSGILTLPHNCSKGVVLIVHGSGSSRHSPREQRVADYLEHQGIATILFDLLTPEEQARDLENASYRFDIDFLARRVEAATHAAREHPALSGLPLGYFGASTGAAAALVAAARNLSSVDAIVSRGGRPDLALEFLPRVLAPTMLIVGGNDTAVLEMNRKALVELNCEKSLQIVPNATHLFEEPGALERVEQLAGDWFAKHLCTCDCVLHPCQK